MHSIQNDLYFGSKERRTGDAAVILSKSALRRTVFLTSAVLLAGVFAWAGSPQSQANEPQAETTYPASTAPKARLHTSSPYHTTSLTTHARSRYESVWGVDSLDVKSVESGQLIRFSYRIVNVAEAAQLNDKKATPYLIDDLRRVSLEVPSVENAGQLRQSTVPEEGRSYWMVFSNKGKIVKPGDHVRVIIGRFHADGLLVH